MNQTASMLYEEQSELLHLRNLVDMEATILKEQLNYLSRDRISRVLIHKELLIRNIRDRLEILDIDKERLAVAMENVETELQTADKDIDRLERQQTYIEVPGKNFSLPCASVQPFNPKEGQTDSDSEGDDAALEYQHDSDNDIDNGPEKR